MTDVRRPTTNRRRATFAVALATLAGLLGLGPASPAAAAPEDMNVTVEFLSGDTLVPITELQASTSHAGDST